MGRSAEPQWKRENRRLYRAFLKYKRDHQGGTNDTLYSYERMYMRFSDYVQKPFGKVTEDDAREFVSMPTLKASGRESWGNPTFAGSPPSLATVKNRTVYLRSLFNWLARKGHLPSDPLADLDVPTVHRGEVIIAEPEDWVPLWTYVTETAAAGGNETTTALEADADCVGFGLGYFIGLREMEVTSLCARHVRSDGWLVGFGRKGSYKNKPVQYMDLLRLFAKKRPDLLVGGIDAFTEPLHRLMREYPELPIMQPWRTKINRPTKYPRPEGYVPDSRFNRRLERAQRAAGLKPNVFTPHDTRRSCGTNLSEMGVRVEVIQGVLGHESLETTMRYIKVRDSGFGHLLGDDDYSPIGLPG